MSKEMPSLKSGILKLPVVRAVNVWSLVFFYFVAADLVDQFQRSAGKVFVDEECVVVFVEFGYYFIVDGDLLVAVAVEEELTWLSYGDHFIGECDHYVVVDAVSESEPAIDLFVEDGAVACFAEVEQVYCGNEVDAIGD